MAKQSKARKGKGWEGEGRQGNERKGNGGTERDRKEVRGCRRKVIYLTLRSKNRLRKKWSVKLRKKIVHYYCF